VHTDKEGTQVRGNRHWSGRGGLGRIFSEGLHRTERGVSSELYGPDGARQKLIAFVRLAQDNGAHAWVRRYMAPLLTILDDSPAPTLDLPVIAAASHADAREDASQAIAQATHLVGDYKRWAKDVDAEIAAQTRLLAALHAEIHRLEGV